MELPLPRSGKPDHKALAPRSGNPDQMVLVYGEYISLSEIKIFQMQDIIYNVFFLNYPLPECTPNSERIYLTFLLNMDSSIFVLFMTKSFISVCKETERLNQSAKFHAFTIM